MLALFALAVYINEVPLYGGLMSVNESNFIEFFAFFPLFYTSIYWLEEVGQYQTMMYAMVFQTISILIAKTADDTEASDSGREVVAEVLSAIAQVYLFNGITKFSGAWFDTKFRSIATATILICGLLGQYTPMTIRYAWYRSDPFLKGENPNVGQLPFPIPDEKDTRKSLSTILDEFKLVLFLMNLVLTIVIIVFFETKPRDYPTLSQ